MIRHWVRSEKRNNTVWQLMYTGAWLKKELVRDEQEPGFGLRLKVQNVGGNIFDPTHFCFYDVNYLISVKSPISLHICIMQNTRLCTNTHAASSSLCE